MTRLHLKWRVLNPDEAALIFDTTAWNLLQEKANALGVDTEDMIAEAIAGLLGRITAKKVTVKD